MRWTKLLLNRPQVLQVIVALSLAVAADKAVINMMLGLRWG